MAKSQTLTRNLSKNTADKKTAKSPNDPSPLQNGFKPIDEDYIASVGFEAFSIISEEINNPAIIIQDGRIAYINSKGLEKFGYSIEDTIGKRVDFLVKKWVEKTSHDDTMNGYFQALSGVPSPVPIIPIIAENGESIPVAPRVAVIEYNQRPALLVVMRDLRQETLLKQQSSEEFESLTNAVNLAAGNLRNTLQSITNAQYYVKKELEANRTHLKKIRNIKNMLEIVDDAVLRADKIIGELVGSLKSKSRAEDWECSA